MQLPDNPDWGSFVPRTLACFDPILQAERDQEREAEEALIETLTNRETDVLALLYERLYDKEIAARLHIAPSTVKTHVNHIYGKLGVKNRREAVRKAKRLGLV